MLDPGGIRQLSNSLTRLGSPRGPCQIAGVIAGRTGEGTARRTIPVDAEAWRIFRQPDAETRQVGVGGDIEHGADPLKCESRHIQNTTLRAFVKRGGILAHR